ncbi:hypothetical protein HYS95_00155 [Candidatus Daviesbacteria bacterium]|nr:hypothetical protein [Candidatus Daviesbacteria bacterium]
MKQFVPARIRIQKDVIIRVVRVLKGRGSVNVRVGQQVSPEEIIGTGTTMAGFRTLNVATLLGISAKDIQKYLKIKLGQKIYKGELIAYKRSGFLSGEKVVTSPADGVADFLNEKSGELKISFLPKKNDLPAGVYGIVEKADYQRGQVIIRAQASRIHGVLGSGRPRDGILKFLSRKDELINKDRIRPEYDGQVLVGGSLFFKDAISSCISSGVSGIITGGINAEDFRGMIGGRLVFPQKIECDVGISVVVCEGFGSVATGDDIFETLQQYEGKFVFLDGNNALVNLPSFSSSSLIKVKNTQLPEFQNLPADNFERSKNLTELQQGMKVRVVGNAYFGEQGKLVALDNTPTLLPSGVKASLATIETSRRKLQVPVANLEVIV